MYGAFFAFGGHSSCCITGVYQISPRPVLVQRVGLFLRLRQAVERLVCRLRQLLIEGEQGQLCAVCLGRLAHATTRTLRTLLAAGYHRHYHHSYDKPSNH